MSEDSIDAADRLLDQINTETHTLLMQSEMGRTRDELAAGLRSWPTSNPYILLYFADDHGITVTRVFHHARDMPAIDVWPRH